jgi:hypothetical protein
VLLAPVEVLDRDPPQLALEDLVRASSSAATGTTRRSDATRRRARGARGPTTIAPPR